MYISFVWSYQAIGSHPHYCSTYWELQLYRHEKPLIQAICLMLSLRMLSFRQGLSFFLQILQTEFLRRDNSVLYARRFASLDSNRFFFGFPSGGGCRLLYVMIYTAIPTTRALLILRIRNPEFCFNTRKPRRWCCNIQNLSPELVWVGLVSSLIHGV